MPARVQSRVRLQSGFCAERKAHRLRLRREKTLDAWRTKGFQAFFTKSRRVVDQALAGIIANPTGYIFSGYY